MLVATVYCGSHRDTQVWCEVADLGCGAAQINCLECNGSGMWDFLVPELPAEPCVSCKGTGKILVAV